MIQVALVFITIANIHLHMEISAADLQIERDGKGRARITLERGVLDNEPGYPSIPSRPVFVALHDGEKAVGVKINSFHYRKLKGKYFVPPQQPPAILPFPGYSPKIVTVEPNSTVYSSSAWYPDAPVVFDRTGNMGGVPIAGLKIYPVRYNPSDSTVEVLEFVDIEIQTRPSHKHVMPPRTEFSSALWNRILRKLVINPEDVNIEPSKDDSTFDYLIVTSNSLMSAFEELADWLNERGIKARIALIDTLLPHFYGRDNAERLREAVKFVYQHYGITYLLLGGDTDVIPDRVAYAMTSNAGFMSDEDSLRADLYFGDLDGTWDANGNNIFGEVDDSVDLYPDIFVGRATVSNLAQAQAFVNKVKLYSEPVSEGYLNHDLFFAEILWNSPYTDAGAGKDLIDSLYVPDSVNITKLYESRGNESPSSVIAAINSGANLQNHDGHGFYYVMGAGTGYLYRSDMDNLSNRQMPGILYSIGCWVGAFDYDAISEHYLKNPHGGGAAFIGNSRYGWGSPGNPGYGYSDKLDTEFYRWVYALGVTEIGAAMALDKAWFIPYSRQANVFRWHQYQVNLLGAPEMRIWRGRPRVLNVTAEDTVFEGGIMHITVQPPVDGFATLSENGRYLISEPLQNGSAELPVPESITSDSITLYVIAYDSYPYHKNVVLRRYGAFVTVSSFSFTDTASSYPDSTPTPGDSGTIDFVITNYGTEPSAEEDFSVSSITDSFSLNGTASIPQLQPGESTTLSFPMRIGIIPFEQARMIASIGGDTVLLSFSVKAPLLRIVDFRADSFIVVGNNHMTLIVANTGNSTAHHGVLRLRADEPSVEFRPDSFILYELSVGDTASYDLIAVIPTSSRGETYITELTAAIDNMEQTDTALLIVGERDYSDDFDADGASSGWSAEGQWHLTSYRTHSGDSAWYCGCESCRRYSNNSNFSLVSPWFIAGEEPTLSFYLWFRVTTYGSDGLYVEVEHGGEAVTLDYIGSGGALDSLIGFWTDWAQYSYPLNFLSEGDTFRIKFRFNSDMEDVEEGFYMDDFALSDVIPLQSGISEDGSTVKNPVFVSLHRSGFSVTVNGEAGATEPLRIYDVTGRLVKSMALLLDNSGRAEAEIKGLRPGVYIVKTRTSSVRAVVLQ